MQTCALAPAILGATDKPGAKAPVVGVGKHTYEAIHDWGELPAGIKYGNTHGVVEDSQGHIYVHHTVHATSESSDSMVVFDEKGKFVKSWGKEFKGGAHGLHIQKEGSTEYLYLCDTARGIVMKATLNGESVYTLGYPDQSEAYKPGADGKKPKYSPTNLAIAPNGDLYVGDGYGSSYINQYNSKGEYIRTFGGKGKEAGKLDCPHGIIVDRRDGTADSDRRRPRQRAHTALHARRQAHRFRQRHQHAVPLQLLQERRRRGAGPGRARDPDGQAEQGDRAPGRRFREQVARHPQALARSLHPGQIRRSARRLLRPQGQHLRCGMGRSRPRDQIAARLIGD